MWSPGPDLNRLARDERGILSSLDRDISPDNTTQHNIHSSGWFAVFGRVLRGYRGLFSSVECQYLLKSHDAIVNR